MDEGAVTEACVGANLLGINDVGVAVGLLEICSRVLPLLMAT